jgi:hypothetical protein
LTGKTMKEERVFKKGRAGGPKADFGSERELEEVLRVLLITS